MSSPVSSSTRPLLEGPATFSEKEFDLLYSNFVSGERSVSSLDEAEVILLGERHDCAAHKIKIEWLINRMARPNDILLTEGSWGKNLILDPASSPLLPSYLKVHGWDSKVELRFHAKLCRTFNKIVSLLEECYRDQSNAKLRLIIQNVNELVQSSIFNQTIDLAKIIQLNYSKEEKETDFELPCKDILKEFLPTYRANFHRLTSESQKVQLDDELKHLFITFAKHTRKFVSDFLSLHIHVSLFALRNVELAKNIKKYSVKGKKVFVYAGKGHLGSHTHYAGPKIGFEVLLKGLRNKKFAILFPKDSKTFLSLFDYHPYTFPLRMSFIGSGIACLAAMMIKRNIVPAIFSSLALLPLAYLAQKHLNFFITKRENYDYLYLERLERRLNHLDKKIEQSLWGNLPPDQIPKDSAIVQGQDSSNTSKGS